MRRLLPCFTLLLASLALAQESHDTYGKTDAQILEMGMEKWSDFFAAKAGGSTSTMTEAAGIYGEVAKRRNDLLLSGKVQTKPRGKILKLRKLMSGFASSSVDVAYCESGGGTMYNTMWAAVTGVVEDTLYRLVSRSGPKAKPAVVSQVTRMFARISKQIEDLHGDKDNLDVFKYADAKKALEAMRKNYGQIVVIARTMSRHDSDIILGFCLQEARNADTDLGE